MTELDPKNSVRKEQLGNPEDNDSSNEAGKPSTEMNDSMQSGDNEKPHKESNSVPETKKDETDSPVELQESEELVNSSDDQSSEVDKDPDVEVSQKTPGSNSQEENTELKKPEKVSETLGETEATNEESVPNEVQPKDNDLKEAEGQDIVEQTANEEKPVDKTEVDSAAPDKVDPVLQKNETKKTQEEEVERLPGLKDVNYGEFSKEQLVDTLRKYISEYHLEEIKNHVETIKSVFYKIHNEEVDRIHSNFIEEGGKEEDFKVEDTPIEINMKELLNIYREKRNDQSKSLEEQKETNLQAKYDIIEGIKELINSQESLNKTFHEFRNLQEHWREIGPVPQKNVKDLWESYHYHVEAFYDYIKINKELRDLDFKKNLNAKLKLCEKAEELLLEPSVVEAFRQLQVLHEQWREIGPVPADKRSEIWERFKDSTSKINHKHQEYFVNLKDEQKKNLQEKTILCEKAEEIADLEIDNGKNWEIKSNELIELQKVWKTIGFAPKKHNTRIYERFRAACDKFFNNKREYFSHNREEQENNLQLKTELCIQAEALQDSTDWRKTTDELIKLQKKWKTIGPVPIKYSDKIWKRFRAACDKFFNNKSSYYNNIDSKYEDNLKAKEELIQKIETYELQSDVSVNLEKLKSFQREWSEIGFVPIKMKDEIQEKYRFVINNKFDQLKLDENKKSILKFKSRIESIASKPNAGRRLNMERDKCYNKLKQLESDITTWENNIGFFSNSKNAESMISDVENKIKAAKEKIIILQEKINILDDLD